jgi:hypothetical protein
LISKKDLAFDELCIFFFSFILDLSVGSYDLSIFLKEGDLLDACLSLAS